MAGGMGQAQEDALTDLKKHAPTPGMEQFRLEFLALLDKHTGALDSSIMLATMAYTVGQTIAMMDATKWTPQQIGELVQSNILQGNSDAIMHAAKWMPSA